MFQDREDGRQSEERESSVKLLRIETPLCSFFSPLIDLRLNDSDHFHPPLITLSSFSPISFSLSLSHSYYSFFFSLIIGLISFASARKFDVVGAETMLRRVSFPLILLFSLYFSPPFFNQFYPTRNVLEREKSVLGYTIRTFLRALLR